MNYTIEFYIDKKYHSIVSEDVHIVAKFVQSYINFMSSKMAVETLLTQAKEEKFSNSFYFIKDKIS